MARLRSRLAVGVVLAVLGTACSNGESSNGSRSGTTASTGTTGTGQRAGDSGAPGDGVSAPAGDFDDAVSGGGPEGADPEAAVASGRIPLSGKYLYERIVNGGESSHWVLEITDAGKGDGWVRQVHTEGNDRVLISELVAWLDDRFMAEAEQRAKDGTYGQVCAWKPAYTHFPLPLDVGDAWTSKAQCQEPPREEDDVIVTRERTLEARVDRTESIEIGNEPVEVLVIERTTVTTTTARSPVADAASIVTVETEKAVDKVSTTRHLLVASEWTFESSIDGVPTDADRNSLTLRYLHPV